MNDIWENLAVKVYASSATELRKAILEAFQRINLDKVSLKELREHLNLRKAVDAELHALITEGFFVPLHKTSYSSEERKNSIDYNGKQIYALHKSTRGGAISDPKEIIKRVEKVYLNLTGGTDGHVPLHEIYQHLSDVDRETLKKIMLQQAAEHEWSLV